MQPKAHPASLEAYIRGLEHRRYRAMLDGDVAVLRELLADQLVYTHSNGDRDTKASYLSKVADGTFVYESIEHPADRMLVADGVVVVVGMMIARARWSGTLHRIHNASAAVWAWDDGRWRLLTYAPTPCAEEDPLGSA